MYVYYIYIYVCILRTIVITLSIIRYTYKKEIDDIGTNLLFLH